MLQKFALALKTKTAEFFAEEEEDEENQRGGGDLDSTVGVITGQRVLVIKADGQRKPSHNLSLLQHGHISSMFAAVSSFHSAYLNLQVAQDPLNVDAVVTADRAAISHLQRLSDLRRGYCLLRKDPGVTTVQGLGLSSQLEAQVQVNQSMLRKFETVFNRLQADVDRKDAEVSALKEELREVESYSSDMERKLGCFCNSVSIEEGEKFLLSIGVFDAILKEAYRAAHRFTKVLIDLLNNSSWDLDAAATSVCPGASFVKSGHHGYALLSYISLGMFSGFGSNGYGLEGDAILPKVDGLSVRQREFLRQFVEYCSFDPLELLALEAEGDFAQFSKRKYHLLIHPGSKFSLFVEASSREGLLDFCQPSTPLYEPFVSMCSFVWMLHKLALAFDRPVEIFQVKQGVEFSMIYMENAVVKKMPSDSCISGMRPKVGFTVFPGFRLGAAVIQCKVYLNHKSCSP